MSHTNHKEKMCIRIFFLVVYLCAETADGLVAGSSVETCRLVWEGRHQQTVDFVRVTLKHGLALPVLDTRI